MGLLEHMEGGANVRVLVLGGTGMLGHMVARVLSKDHDVVATSRGKIRGEWDNLVLDISGLFKGPRWRFFDARKKETTVLGSAYEKPEWVINCIGATKPDIDGSRNSVENAIDLNSMFPYWLARQADLLEFNVIQIGTDCVYSGYAGPYNERSPHDALDEYGRTKSLGEKAVTSRVALLRTSIIGPELNRKKFLLEWFLGVDQGVEGYTNHMWNGITTLAFAQICKGMIENNSTPCYQHIVPAHPVTKADLLLYIKDAYGIDTHVAKVGSGDIVDRHLSTCYDDTNNKLWANAGFSEPPSIDRLLRELKEYEIAHNLRDSA